MVARGLKPLIALLASGIPGAAPPGLHFAEVAASAGIRATIVCGGPEKKWIPEANGSGAAWLDYDRDGWIDLLVVNGSTMDRLAKIVQGAGAGTAAQGAYLFRNLGNGRFRDVSASSGIANPYWGTGANAADYDNDGDPDILITTIGLDLLWRNNGDGTFSEVGKAAGLSRKLAWHTGSAFGDYDGDGDLDLYVAGYVDLSALALERPAPVCQYQGLAVFCGPLGVKGERDLLYRNNGDGTFSDVTAAAGVEDAGRYHGFAAVFEDFNQDGRPDIFVANDSDPNYLYLNAGGGKFAESALASGLAVNADGKTQANMGAAVGDYDNDGRLDLLTTTFSDDYFPLFRQHADGAFEDVAFQAGLGTATVPYLGWAGGFADLDNDGRRELWLANGHVYPDIGKVSRNAYFQPVAAFSSRAGKFARVWQFPAMPDNSYRGACAGDFDNDGRTDLVVMPISGNPLLLANRTETGNSWIGLLLAARRGNRDAIGARVRVEACGKAQYDSVRNGGGYLSRDDPRLRFGLGLCKQADVAVTWPSGARQTLAGLEVNRYHSLVEP